MVIAKDQVIKFVADYVDENHAPKYEIKITAWDRGTNQQNNAFHALLFLYWSSGCCSDATYEDLRNRSKLFAGEEVVKFWLIIKGKAFSLETERPEYPDGCIAKSWAEFSVKQRSICIEKLVAEMIEAGVNSAEFGSIMDAIFSVNKE